eukprot:gene8536-983_t
MSAQMRTVPIVRRLTTFYGSAKPPQARVFNQAPALEDFDAYESDAILQACVKEYGAEWANPQLSTVGKLAGSKYMAQLAQDANDNPPVFESHDRSGNRVDTVKYHPAYHEIMRLGIEAEIPSFSWRNHDKKGASVARSALGYLMYQAESGTQCPQTMTFACVSPLNYMTHDQRSICNFAEKAITPEYDPRNVSAIEKAGVTIGMSMTEKQGGSDVRANITEATLIDSSVSGSNTAYFLNGHKWFTSAPMSDAFLTLAQTSNGLSCFIVPRWIPQTGERNEGLRFQRLKSKIGDRSNASSEVEYHNAYGELLGQEGRGISVILEMVQNTRLDCSVGSSALMRRALLEAINHVGHRKAFGNVLLNSPPMAAVIADLTVESEAATALAFRVAATFDKHATDHEKDLGRIITAIAKYHVCKRATQFVYEAMECLGGNGYVEDGIMGRLFRQAPLNAIWEGSGNVICLDVLRCFKREPKAVEALMHELATLNHIPEYSHQFNKLKADLSSLQDNLASVRSVVGTTALLLQAVALSKTSVQPVFDAFVRSRLMGGPRLEYGAIDNTWDIPNIIKQSNKIVRATDTSISSWMPLHRTTRTLHTTAEPCTRPRNLPYVTDEEVAKRRAEGDWDCPKCGRLNFLYTDTCACSYVLTAPLARDGDWVCSFCGDYVFAYKTKCRCGEPRPSWL